MPGNQLETAYGAEPYSHFAAGTTLDRVSFLRDDYSFLHAAFNDPSAKFLVLNELCPYVESVPRSSKQQEQGTKDVVFKPRAPRFKIKYVEGTNGPLREVMGQPFERDAAAVQASWDSTKDAPGLDHPVIVFLGLDQVGDSAFKYIKKDTRTPTSQTYTGQPCFALDVGKAHVRSAGLQTRIDRLFQDPVFTDSPAKVASARTLVPVTQRLRPADAAAYAQARMYLDWLQRNPFCAGCGSTALPVHGGTKLVCPAQDRALLPNQRKPCATRGTLSNLAFPRTDVSIITAVLDQSGTRLLLGRGPKWPARFFSCLAGFLEPGETVEQCVRREVFEESGLAVGRVVVHATQVWPFPANIMVGCIAQVAAEAPHGDEVKLEHDPELEQANWYSLAEIEASLVLSARDYKPAPGEKANDVPLIPGPEALAFTLLEAVVSGRVRGFDRVSSKL